MEKKLKEAKQITVKKNLLFVLWTYSLLNIVHIERELLFLRFIYNCYADYVVYKFANDGYKCYSLTIYQSFIQSFAHLFISLCHIHTSLLKRHSLLLFAIINRFSQL